MVQFLEEVITAIISLGMAPKKYGKTPVLMMTDGQAVQENRISTVLLAKNGTAYGTACNINWHSQYSVCGPNVKGPAKTPQVILTSIQAVSLSSNIGLYLAKNSSLYAVGNGNGFGQPRSREIYLQIADNVKAIAAAWSASYFITENGTAFGLGRLPYLSSQPCYPPYQAGVVSKSCYAPSWPMPRVKLLEGANFVAASPKIALFVI